MALDLDWRWHQTALGFGCMMSINPDAHLVGELDHMHWGVEMARKGGVPADRVLNAMMFADTTRYFRQKAALARPRRLIRRPGSSRHAGATEVSPFHLGNGTA